MAEVLGPRLGEGREADVYRRLSRALAEAHLAVHEAEAPADLPELRETLAARIGDAPLPTQLRSFALRVLDGLPAGDRLCHGDLHPGNVLVDTDRSRVIDWANATRGAPDADHARTLFLLRRANPLPGTSRVSRALIAGGRSIDLRAGVRLRLPRRHAEPAPARRVVAYRARRGAAERGHRSRACHARPPA